MTQVTSAVSIAHPSASQSGPIHPIRQDIRREARGNDTPLHGSSIISGRRHVICKATVARPHSKIARVPRIYLVLLSICAYTVVLFINETAPPSSGISISIRMARTGSVREMGDLGCAIFDMTASRPLPLLQFHCGYPPCLHGSLCRLCQILLVLAPLFVTTPLPLALV
jgi:hypothetical protein